MGESSQKRNNSIFYCSFKNDGKGSLKGDMVGFRILSAFYIKERLNNERAHCAITTGSGVNELYIRST